MRNSVSGQADRCKALEAHPPFEKGKQVSIPLPVRAATPTLHSLCGKSLLINKKKKKKVLYKKKRNAVSLNKHSSSSRHQ